MRALGKFIRRPAVGLLGSFVLAAGVFSPVIWMPIMGTVTYANEPQGHGAAILLGCAVLAAVLTVLRAYGWLWVPALAALAELSSTIIDFNRQAAAFEAQVNSGGLPDAFEMLAGAAMQSARFEWGVAVVAAGAVFLLAAAVLRD